MPLYNPLIQNIDDIEGLSVVLDGYTPVQTELEHYYHHSDTIQKILNSLDGYINGTFGTIFFDAYNECVSTTTSSEWQSKLIMTIPVLVSGKYRISFFYEWAFANPSADFCAMVHIDNESIIVSNQRNEPADSSGYTWTPTSGFMYTNLSAGIHTIEIKYKSAVNGKSAQIRYARLEIWRIR